MKSDFLSDINNCDFIVLTETWNRPNFDIPGFKSFITQLNQKASAGRRSGGITLLFKDHFQNNVTMIQKSSNSIWCKLSKEIWGYTKDVFICGLYIPPQNSSYFSTDMFEQLENDIICFLSKGHVIRVGDFNARAGKYTDSVSKEGNNLKENDRSEISLHPPHQNSFDNTINSHGKRLLEIFNTLI